MIIPVLRKNECHVWWADPRHQPVDDLLTELSDLEVSRAEGYRRESARRTFITASWLLRVTAAAQLAVSPAALRIDRQCPDCGKPHGKPQIRDERLTLHVSVSHSGGRVAIAHSPSAEIGVDVEEITDAPVAKAALSPAEWSALKSLPLRERKAGFARVWVRKEAALKATGHGLRIPPNRVVVSGPRQGPELLSWPLDLSPRSLQIHTLNPGSGYTAAVAIISDDRGITVTESDATHLHQAYFPSPATTPQAA